MQNGIPSIAEMDADWEGKRYTKDGVDMPGPEVTSEEFVIAGYGTQFFAQKLESGRKVMEAGGGHHLERVDSSPL